MAVPPVGSEAVVNETYENLQNAGIIIENLHLINLTDFIKSWKNASLGTDRANTFLVSRFDHKPVKYLES